jgi:DNA (cytosine-5)-methyltransferase 1
VKCYSDIREVSLPVGQFDVLCGGFPCQDVSVAYSTGPKQSILGERSGLWFEYLRLIQEGKPNWVIIENVEALRNQGLAIILQQLAALGYDAEWHVIPAWAVGKPHSRKRLWIIAHAASHRLQRVQPFPLQGLRNVSWLENGRVAQNFLLRRDPAAPMLIGRGHGIPDYVDRIKALGNAIVPQIAYEIGMAILEAESA